MDFNCFLIYHWFWETCRGYWWVWCVSGLVACYGFMGFIDYDSGVGFHWLLATGFIDVDSFTCLTCWLLVVTVSLVACYGFHGFSYSYTCLLATGLMGLLVHLLVCLLVFLLHWLCASFIPIWMSFMLSFHKYSWYWIVIFG